MNKHCRCAACGALNARYAKDPELLAHYRKKLLIEGWAGEPDRVEVAYFQAHSPKAERARKQQAQGPGGPS